MVPMLLSDMQTFLQFQSPILLKRKVYSLANIHSYDHCFSILKNTIFFISIGQLHGNEFDSVGEEVFLTVELKNLRIFQKNADKLWHMSANEKPFGV